jgi:hypothetical protein
MARVVAFTERSRPRAVVAKADYGGGAADYRDDAKDAERDDHRDATLSYFFMNTV